MAATDSVRITKSFSYKGGTKLWSNRYHLAGGVPTTDTLRSQLLDAVVAAEAPCFGVGVTIVKGEYLLAGSDVAHLTNTYTTAGTLTTTGGQLTPGDCAIAVRYSTTQRTSKNHPVYLFNYYHAVWSVSPSNKDTPLAAQLSALTTYAGHWVSGLAYAGGAFTVERAGPNGAVAQAASVLPYITHRDFPR